MFFDTHAHFDAGDPESDVGTIMARAVAAGVERVVAIGGSASLNAGALAAVTAQPLRMRAALGWGRDLAGDLAASAPRLAEAVGAIEAQARASAGVVAIGEIGLDYHYAPETAPAQRALFAAQLALARRLDLPVVVHSRDADADTLALLGEFCAAGAAGRRGRGVLHCFTGGAAFAEALVALGIDISFSGILTFRNADALRAVARSVPAERLLIETDAPYLAPVPVRGRRNEPAFLRHVAEQLADVRLCSLQAIAELTNANARRLFRWAE